MPAKTILRALLLTGAAVAALTPPAFAASKSEDARIDALQQQLQQLDAELRDLKSHDADQTDISGQVIDLKRSTAAQYADIHNQIDGLPRTKLDNGRLSVSSADGNFTLAIRGLAQFDWGYYGQSAHAATLPAAFGPDFGSGANFRRVYLGLQGKVFGDWSYNLNFDFGGSGGTETPGHIQSVYLEYDGFAPFAVRIGAYPPPANLEDGVSASDTLFLERNSPSDLQRNIAGGDGRDAVTLLYTTDRVFGALSYTGNKVSDGAKALAAAGATAAPNFDEQQALLGRLSWLPVSNEHAHWLIGVNGTYVIKPADLVANGSATLSTTPGASPLGTISLSDPPEVTIDSNGTALASTGALGARHVSQWGVETSGNWDNFYGQGGYYGFEVLRSPQAFKTFTNASTSATTIVQPNNDSFSGYYGQVSWILTGESKGYNSATGAFTPPKPAHPFSFDGSGWGAFELAARYSDLDLNSHANDGANVITAFTGTTPTYTFYNTVRGGDQRIATLGLNWYPNNAIRFALDYQLIQSSRLQSPAAVSTSGTPVLPTVNGGQNLQVIALRTQISL